MSRQTTKRLRVRLDVVVEFPEDLRRLPGDPKDEVEHLAAMYDGLHEGIRRAYGVDVKRVSGHHTIGLDYRPSAGKARSR